MSQSLSEISGIHFVLGGARSGKSRRAEALATEFPENHGTLPVLYIATCATTHGLDAEMAERIARHRADRPSHWKTLENRFDLAVIFAEHPGHIVLLDCLTLWLSWQMGLGLSEAQILAALEEALDAARRHSIRLIAVSNELGMGLVPLGAENRAYRDLVGRANQLVARHADAAEFVAAGIPLRLK
jgi:adenosylcobinamide kinase/adenosylcobinamide-phosphate guanylyltransferase